ncbi:methyltransferase domain-containing protein [Thiorhodovibrio frisius]|uniref:methyltransferase domain-containing protein n=1 Tax=Thiorhodovibrio frisius TaxID=631362 RepID=UPI00022C6C47|nr:class I SAM-dependent methyltransferase [Thiorhodovibrio frisius]WPL20134.1 Methyltransferase domain protein [Thiorhodovibrio frisius]
MQPGPGVELVLQDPHHLPLDEASVDVVVSTSCLEHDPLFWLTFGEMLRVLKPGGFLYINAPSNGSYHGYPYDHWRFYPDAGRALAQWAERLSRPATLIESFIGERDGETWANNVMVLAHDPLEHALPARLICDQWPGAINIRRQGSDELERFTKAPEDSRKLKKVRTRVKQLQGQLQQSEAPKPEPA